MRPKNSRNLAAALRALGVPVTLKLYPKCSHADTVAALTTLLRGRAPTLADITSLRRQGSRRELRMRAVRGGRRRHRVNLAETIREESLQADLFLANQSGLRKSHRRSACRAPRKCRRPW